jgi:hypothetical protein
VRNERDLIACRRPAELKIEGWCACQNPTFAISHAKRFRHWVPSIVLEFPTAPLGIVAKQVSPLHEKPLQSDNIRLGVLVVFTEQQISELITAALIAEVSNLSNEIVDNRRVHLSAVNDYVGVRVIARLSVRHLLVRAF